MTNREIFEKAINKAKEHGFSFNDYQFEHFLSVVIKKHGINTIDGNFLHGLLLSHDFAKAFWGMCKICKDCGSEGVQLATGGYFCLDCRVFHKHSSLEKWQYHLQQMVIEKEPLKYLEKFLTEDKSR